METLPRRVYLRSQMIAARQAFPVHAHRWNQLVYTTSGSLTVMLKDNWYVITPEQAIWIPTGTLHTTGSFSGAAFRNLYVADSPELRMPAHCAVLAVPPLLRALIVELDATAARENGSAYIDHIDTLVIDLLHRAETRSFSLPWPRSEPLSRVCEVLYAAPGDGRTVDQWGRELAISPRTLARRFEAEVGMTLREWRRQLRLFRAQEWLAAGRSITGIAFDLGYTSPSAFTFMFRQEMGCSPSDWLRKA